MAVYNFGIGITATDDGASGAIGSVIESLTALEDRAKSFAAFSPFAQSQSDADALKNTLTSMAGIQGPRFDPSLFEFDTSSLDGIAGTITEIRDILLSSSIEVIDGVGAIEAGLQDARVTFGEIAGAATLTSDTVAGISPHLQDAAAAAGMLDQALGGVEAPQVDIGDLGGSAEAAAGADAGAGVAAPEVDTSGLDDVSIAILEIRDILAAAFGEIAAASGDFQAAFAGTADEIGDAAGAAQALGADMGAVAGGAKTAASGLAGAGASAKKMGEAEAELRFETDKAYDALVKADKAGRKFFAGQVSMGGLKDAFKAVTGAASGFLSLIMSDDSISMLEHQSVRLTARLGESREGAMGFAHSVLTVANESKVGWESVAELATNVESSGMSFRKMSADSQEGLAKLVGVFGVSGEAAAAFASDMRMSGGSITGMLDQSAKFEQQFGVPGLLEQLPAASAAAREAVAQFGAGVSGNAVEATADIQRMTAQFTKGMGKSVPQAAAMATAVFKRMSGEISGLEDVMLGLSDSFSPMQEGLLQAGVGFEDMAGLLEKGKKEPLKFAEDMHKLMDSMDPDSARRLQKQLAGGFPEIAELLQDKDKLNLAMKEGMPAKALTDSEKQTQSFAAMADSMRDNAKDSRDMALAMTGITTELAKLAASEGIGMILKGIVAGVQEVNRYAIEMSAAYHDNIDLIVAYAEVAYVSLKNAANWIGRAFMDAWGFMSEGGQGAFEMLTYGAVEGIMWFVDTVKIALITSAAGWGMIFDGIGLLVAKSLGWVTQTFWEMVGKVSGGLASLGESAAKLLDKIPGMGDAAKSLREAVGSLAAAQVGADVLRQQSADSIAAKEKEAQASVLARIAGVEAEKAAIAAVDKQREDAHTKKMDAILDENVARRAASDAAAERDKAELKGTFESIDAIQEEKRVKEDAARYKAAGVSNTAGAKGGQQEAAPKLPPTAASPVDATRPKPPAANGAMGAPPQPAAPTGPPPPAPTATPVGAATKAGTLQPTQPAPDAPKALPAGQQMAQRVILEVSPSKNANTHFERAIAELDMKIMEGGRA